MSIRFIYSLIFLYTLGLNTLFGQDYEEIYNLTSQKIDFYWSLRTGKKEIKDNVLKYIDTVSNTEKLSPQEKHLLQLNAKAEIEFIFSNKNEAHKLLLEAVVYSDKNKLNPLSMVNIYQLLFGINVSIFNLDKAKLYSDKLNQNFDLYSSGRYKFAACKSREILGRLSNDTTLVLKAFKQRASIDITDSSLYYDVQLDKFIFLNNKDSVSKYTHLAFRTTDSSILMTRYMRLLKFYSQNEENDSAYKYASLLLNDEYAKQVVKYQEKSLEKLIEVKIERGDTSKLKQLQSKLKDLKKGISKKQAIDIANRETKYNNSTNTIPFWFYLVLTIFISIVLGVIFFKSNKKIEKEEFKRYIIPNEHEEKIKEALNKLKADYFYLNRNISLTSLGEKYGIINVNYISKYISNNFSDSFPNWIAKLRLNYFLTHREEFRDCDEDEVSFKLGFGSVRTFRKHLKLNGYETFDSLSRK